jgi:hypothetical protein
MDRASKDPAIMDSLRFTSKRNFILQQGLEESTPQNCPVRYSALMFQPRVIAAILLIGIVYQSPVLFLCLAAILWWSALLPGLNPFDAVYNITLGTRPGAARLHRAPPPRRFAQIIAGALSLAICISLFTGSLGVAYIIEVFFAVAVAGLVFGRFCLGSFLFHLLNGKIKFALRTLPWVRWR